MGDAGRSILSLVFCSILMHSVVCAEWKPVDNSTMNGALLYSSKCNIERREKLSSHEFEAHYKLLGIPVSILYKSTSLFFFAYTMVNEAFVVLFK
jgi:hypothetical protein